MPRRELRIAWAGRHKVAAWEPLYADYRRRIGRHIPVRECAVRAQGGDEAKRLEREAEALARVAEGVVVALDRRGEGLSSEAWAKRMRGWLQQPDGVTFVLGSDLGLDQVLLRRSAEVISFGPVTLAHRLAKLVLYEQIYRGIAQLRGIKYHRKPVSQA